MNPASSTLPLLEAMQIYFQGEKIEALVFILPVGLLSIVFGAWLWSDGGPGFARGVAIPFLAMGLLMTTVGAVVGYRTPDQVERLHMGLQQAPQATVAAESKRMAKVDAELWQAVQEALAVHLCLTCTNTRFPVIHEADRSIHDIRCSHQEKAR